MTARTAAVAALYLGTIVAANYAITRYGLVPVGFGLLAPAGVYFAGAALAMRDGLQELGGRWAVVAAILAGAALSFVVADGRLALASAAAFLVSESIDFAVYTPLRERSRAGAVAASNVVGALVDTFLFLPLAGFPLALWRGQVLGKSWAILPALAVVLLVRRRQRT